MPIMDDEHKVTNALFPGVQEEVDSTSYMVIGNL